MRRRPWWLWTGCLAVWSRDDKLRTPRWLAFAAVLSQQSVYALRVALIASVRHELGAAPELLREELGFYAQKREDSWRAGML